MSKIAMIGIHSQQAVQQVDLKTGLLYCLELDELSGSVAYDETAGFNFSNVNIVSVNQTGKIDKAYLFNGTSQYLQWNNASDALNPVTYHSMSAWVKRTGLSGNSTGIIIGKYHSSANYRCYFLALINSNHATIPNRLSFTSYTSADVAVQLLYNPGSNIWDNNWHHVVATRSGLTGYMKIYLNGTLVASLSGATHSQKQQTLTVRDMVGGCSKIITTPDGFFKGYIDQAATWNIELSAAQVTALYNGGNGLTYANWQ